MLALIGILCLDLSILPSSKLAFSKAIHSFLYWESCYAVCFVGMPKETKADEKGGTLPTALLFPFTCWHKEDDERGMWGEEKERKGFSFGLVISH